MTKQCQFSATGAQRTRWQKTFYQYRCLRCARVAWSPFDEAQRIHRPCEVEWRWWLLGDHLTAALHLLGIDETADWLNKRLLWELAPSGVVSCSIGDAKCGCESRRAQLNRIGATLRRGGLQFVRRTPIHREWRRFARWCDAPMVQFLDKLKRWEGPT